MARGPKQRPNPRLGQWAPCSGQTTATHTYDTAGQLTVEGQAATSSGTKRVA